MNNLSENKELARFADACSELIHNNFHFKNESSSLILHNENEWTGFLCRTGTAQCDGVYFPKTSEAHLNLGSDFLPLNFFHEFIGHGLFCEHSVIGRRIVEFENQIKDLRCQNEEQFREKCAEFQTYLAQHLHNYEGFALWMESFLSRTFGLDELFRKKIKRIHLQDRQILDFFMDYEKKYGARALMYQLGFPKHYDNKILPHILDHIYQDDIRGAEIVILYGSRKPYADVDLFAISEKKIIANNAWLDIYCLSKEEVMKHIALLDISVTDPLFSGELLIGNKNTFEELKQKIIAMPITQEAVEYNLMMSYEQINLSKEQKSKFKERTGISYADSYQKNAQELAKGIKNLTLKKLL